MSRFAEVLDHFPLTNVTLRTWDKTDPVPDTIKLYLHFEHKLVIETVQSRSWLIKTTEEAGKTRAAVFEATQVETRVSSDPLFVLDTQSEGTNEYAHTLNTLVHLIAETEMLVTEKVVNPWT